MPKSGAERIRDYRARQKASGGFDSSRRYSKEDKRDARRQKPSKPFVGCDGEGAGTDAQGRQLYMLLRIGREELYTGSSLRTVECLDFICNSVPDSILVGFSFGYDVTMILRDLPEAQQRRLFEPKLFEAGKSPYVYYKDFDIDYLPRNYFRVKRVKIERNADGSEKRIPIKGSTRTIFETFGFFQKSFLKTLESFKVGTNEQRASIAENKARRSDFTSIDQMERDYCALECELLAELMERLRENCQAAGIIPSTWAGAGKLAAKLHSLHKTTDGATADLHTRIEVREMASMAYYGGRFEITRVGMINQKVYEYDICSAYPDAMRKLPCLIHGQWIDADPKELRNCNDLFIAGITFSHARGPGEAFGQLCGFPVRTREGHLNWPRQAGGIYWSPEIRAAEKLGAKVTYQKGYRYVAGCDCCAFDWLEGLYNYRKSIGSQGAGYPIKLGINALYGKLAQRKGNGKYHNMVWAGLITAYTRAKLIDAASQAPDQIVMLATDGVYSLVPLDLDIGDKLGQWECNELDGLFIVQPGLYWSPSKRKKKSRGLSGSFFAEPGRTEGFEQAFHEWATRDQHGLTTDFPSVPVPVPGFIGLKLALSRNKPLTAGTWVKETRDISFDYRNKRQLHKWQDGHIITACKPGSKGLLSLPHKDFIKAGGAEVWEHAREVLLEQPDYIDMSPPYED